VKTAGATFALATALVLAGLSPALAEGRQGESPAWMAPVAGVKLTAVDGSTMTLAASEGGFALALAAPNGASQRSSFAFVSDKLGTISDDADSGHVIGFFRETESGLEVQFGDGRSETIVANDAGGISLMLHASTGEASCVSWYPSGHVFGAAEKRAALAAYANRLGIADRPKKAQHAVSTCAPAAHIAKKSPPYKIGMYSGPAVTNSGAAGLTPVAVRTSEVHMIDGAVAAPLAAISPPAATLQPAAPVVQQPPPQPMTAQPAQVTLAAAVPDGHGASDCLSVEFDGANIGFRNHCAYGVQFAYCLQKASDPAADCGAGAKAGAVGANGFALLLAHFNSKSADAEHDFRWVACSGGNGSVTAHLDRADPPAGRCIRAGAT
jgi:hypothetical protein